MKRSTMLCLLFGAAASGAGMAGAAEKSGGGTQAFPVDPPIAVADGQPEWRWIGERVNPSAACPAVAHWTVKPLFCEPLTPSDPLYGPCTADAPPLPPGLAPFCAYEYTALDTPVTATDKAALLALKGGPLSKLDPDSMGIAGFGSGMQDDVWQQLANHFKQQTGLPSPLPGTPLVPSPLIRLAVIDTQPTRTVDSDEAPHNSVHGNTLLNMADELLCDDFGECAAIPASRLALGYVCPLDIHVNKSNCRDPNMGGFIGTLGDLARAIRLETRTWIDPLASGHRLVLNLSVAWHPRFGGLQANLSDMEAPVRAVYAAIADAQCRGALTIAAAGNITGGPESQNDPMLPAAWEQRPALTQAECQSRIAPTIPPNIFPPPGADHRPFVHAAAGVDGSDLPLGNARPNSEPSLVGYGDHADVQDESIAGLVPTATLTGSSVSALVTSATVAWTWQVANLQITPPLAPYQIMDIVYNTGNKLTRTADFCLGGTPASPCPVNPRPVVTEVQICKAIDSIAGSSTCPVVVPLDLGFEDVGFFPVSLTLFGSTMSDPSCPQSVRFMSGAQPENGCPFSQYYTRLAEPWTTEPLEGFTAPQPNDAPCPNCGGGHARVAARGVDQNLWIEIDDEREWSLTDATLLCNNELYAIGPYLVSKGMSPLVPGSKVKLLLDDGRCQPGSDMKLYFRDDSGESTVDTLLQAGSLDTDEDGVPDASDNCTEVVNADQRDTNGDGIGNACDPDLTEDCVVNFADLGEFEAVFFTSDPDADFDGSGNVNFTDLGIMKSFFFLPPGPSGVPNACSL